MLCGGIRLIELPRLRDGEVFYMHGILIGNRRMIHVLVTNDIHLLMHASHLHTPRHCHDDGLSIESRIIIIIMIFGAAKADEDDVAHRRP